MEWIKITPETELPNECGLLLSHEWAGDRYYEFGYTVKGMFESDTNSPLSKFTHYCVITEPKD